MMLSQFRNVVLGKSALAAKQASKVARIGQFQQSQMSTFAASQLAEGEYLDDTHSMYLNEPLASFTQRRRFRQNGQVINEIMEVELSRETLIET